VTFAEPPATAAWRHRDARDGFEVVFLRRADVRYRFDGHTAAMEGDAAFAVRYVIFLDDGWRTLGARVVSESRTRTRYLELETRGDRAWQVNGEAAPHLAGCMDIDLEASVLTNAIPVHRLALDVGQEAVVPAAYVRAIDLSVERLEQRYVRMDDEGGRQRYRYTAPAFDFECELTYDSSGLVRDYPGIAVRVA
jgi:uncharacterized protein